MPRVPGPSLQVHRGLLSCLLSASPSSGRQQVAAQRRAPPNSPMPKHAIDRVLTAPDPWQALGLNETTADEAAVLKAYRELSRKVHPDKNPEQRERATRAFQHLQACRDQIIDALANQWRSRASVKPRKHAAAGGGDATSDWSGSRWQSAWSAASRAWDKDYVNAREAWSEAHVEWQRREAQRRRVEHHGDKARSRAAACEEAALAGTSQEAPRTRKTGSTWASDLFGY